MKTLSKLFWPPLAVLVAAMLALWSFEPLLPQQAVLPVSSIVVTGALAFLVGYLIFLRLRIRTLSVDLSEILSVEDQERLEEFPLPLMLVLQNGELAWYNRLCRESVLMSGQAHGKKVKEIFSGLTIENKNAMQAGLQLTYKCNKYTAFVVPHTHNETTASLVYLVDDTELKNYKERYLRTRITVMMVMIDNYEELLQSAREAERPQSLAGIEYAVSGYMKGFGALLCQVERDKFFAMVEESSMQEIIASRFSLLDEVRKIEVAPRVPATLSIGVGQHAGSLTEAEGMARQALDMALGRGGDQAAVKTQNGYEFYGGVSKGVEKRTKVKSRIIANAMCELIASSSNVIIMGHRFADLDCIGAGVGLYRAVQLLGKQVNICVNLDKNLAQPLIEKLEASGENYEDAFLSPAGALGIIGKDTLLIIVDVHAKHFLESQEVYDKCRSVVVIDHHRKMVDYIDNAVIFYHEPYASSASEMVTELIQYLGLPKNPGSVEAEAMLAGIMLDTKNFVMKAGVRTFEAAAYLKRLGADTIEVRKLFSSPMEAYQKKARIVSSANVYRRCAVSVFSGVAEDIKLIAPQAADELLSISDVDASFVIFESGTQVEITSRSMGAVNVQIIMERLGGGGHMTMAAAQLTEIDIEEAHRTLLSVLDEYFDTLKRD